MQLRLRRGESLQKRPGAAQKNAPVVRSACFFIKIGCFAQDSTPEDPTPLEPEAVAAARRELLQQEPPHLQAVAAVTGANMGSRTWGGRRLLWLTVQGITAQEVDAVLQGAALQPAKRQVHGNAIVLGFERSDARAEAASKFPADATTNGKPAVKPVKDAGRTYRLLRELEQPCAVPPRMYCQGSVCH